MLPEEFPADGPPVSIVIPSFDMARYAVACIESAMGQTYRNLEIIVVDDASEQPTATLMEQAARGDSRVTVHRNTENIGAAANFLRGAEMASAPLVKYLNADDVLVPEAVSILVAGMASEMTTMTFGSSELIDSEGRATPWQVEMIRGAAAHFQGDVLGRHILTTGSSMPAPTCTLLRREFLLTALDDAIGFERAMSRQHGYTACPVDMIMYLSLCCRGEVANVGRCVAQVRGHRESRSSALLSKIDWHSSYLSVIEWAEERGLMQDGVEVAAALIVFVQRFLNNRRFFDVSDPSSCARGSDALLAALCRIDSLRSRLGPELDAFLSPELRDVWAALRGDLPTLLETLGTLGPAALGG